MGFKKGCRPFIGMDGCFLKGPFDDHLLSAGSIDGDNSIFPIAAVIVYVENKETWDFFNVEPEGSYRH